MDNLHKATLRALKQDLPEARLKGLMWSFRRHYWDLKADQGEQLLELFLYAPELKHEWLLRHELILIYESPCIPEQAGHQFDAWIQKVCDSRLACFDEFIQLLEKSRTDILTYFDGDHASGFVEGLSNKLKVVKRRCFGLLDPGRLFQRIQIDLQEWIELL